MAPIKSTILKCFFLFGVPSERFLLVGVKEKNTFHISQKAYVYSENALIRFAAWTS
jgi:hypothetical protein